MLINQETGGISAAVEVDENMTKCGRYSYCWPRDAVFITKALDSLKMLKETEKFYKIFCKDTQNKMVCGSKDSIQTKGWLHVGDIK